MTRESASSKKTLPVNASASGAEDKDPDGSNRLLNKLDAADLESPVEQKAAGRRASYRRSDVVVTIEHPGGGVAKATVVTRNLSATSMAFLHAGFAYTGSRIVVTMKRRDGSVENILGSVAGCRMVEGRTHEVVVKFLTRIDPLSLAPSSSASDDGHNSSVELADLRGRVLHLDDSPMDHRLMKQCLTGSCVELTSVSTADEAMKLFESKAFDILVCDLWLEKGDSLGLIKDVRAKGFSGPILVLTAEGAATTLEAVKAAGVDRTQSKPFRRDQMISVMTDLHRLAGAILPAASITSTLGDDPTVGPTLPDYLEFAREQSGKLARAIKEDDLPGARLVCLNIKGSAAGYGFLALEDAAKSAVKWLDTTASVKESRSVLRTVELLAANLKVPGQAGSASTEAGEGVAA